MKAWAAQVAFACVVIVVCGVLFASRLPKGVDGRQSIWNTAVACADNMPEFPACPTGATPPPDYCNRFGETPYCLLQHPIAPVRCVTFCGAWTTGGHWVVTLSRVMPPVADGWLAERATLKQTVSGDTLP
jgi:hypothetical protein